MKGDAASMEPSVSADGRYVAFTSAATNLVAGDTNGVYDIFVKDRQTGAIERVSVRSDGAEGTPGASSHGVISGDGRYVVFLSGSQLTTIPPNPACTALNPCNDVYVHDRQTGETTLANLANDGARANASALQPSISDDGRYVVFLSNASNLVAGIVDTLPHVYLRDRTLGTTIRIDRLPNGQTGDEGATQPIISRDGSTIAFISEFEALDPTPDPVPCPSPLCWRAYIADRASGAVSRVPLRDGVIDANIINVDVIQTPALSADGHAVAFVATTLFIDGDRVPHFTDLDLVFDRTTGHVRVATTRQNGPVSYAARAAIDASGRVTAFCEPSIPLNPSISVILMKDLVTGWSTILPATQGLDNCSGLALSGDGNVLVFSTSQHDLILPVDPPLDIDDVFAYTRDTDHDGMPDDWETQYGLNPSDPSDATLDPDGDGKTNLQEYIARTNPRGTFTRYLAEGAENSFFHTRITLYNPNDVPALVLMRYLGDSGSVRNLTFTLPARTQISPSLTPGLDPPPPDASFSTVVESDQFVAVERTMQWGTTEIYGSHAETAVAAPSTTWFFAEGATHGNFDLFYLLQNPGDTPATVSITYLLPAGQAPIVRPYTVNPHSRLTIWVDQEPGLGATDVSAKVASDVPILAERSMYFSTAAQPFAGGTGGAGIPQAATQWFAPEGATGGFFDLFILIGNPSTQDAEVTVTYLLEDGTSIDKQYTVAAESRVTISVKGEDPRLAATSLSTRVTSTNAVPIVVERAMWWPSPNWYEGHLTAATTETGVAWVLADGWLSANSITTTQTYLLIANPSATPAHVTLDLTGVHYDFDGTTPIACTGAVDVKAHSRFTIDLEALCQLNLAGPASSLGGVVRSDGAAIVVERSTYSSNASQFWASGSSTLLTKLP